MVTCLKINTVMGGFKLLESHNTNSISLRLVFYYICITNYVLDCSMHTLYNTIAVLI